jgi:hypothetical protein
MNMGEYKITLDHSNAIVRVVATGNFDKYLGDKMITKTRIAASENGYNIFCDATKAKVNVSVIDWFNLPRTLPVLQDQNIRRIKSAILIPSGKQAENYKFYETVTYNVGMNLRVFLDEEEAINWLTSK